MSVKIKIIYFGSIKSLIKKDSEIIKVAQHFTVQELVKQLTACHPSIKNQIFKVAVNLCIENENKILKDNDEVAILPAFAGG